jgi:ATP/maltotriose-dependent transcriptional regulator MalT
MFIGIELKEEMNIIALRLSEAAQPMKASLNYDIDNERWRFAAISASNLSELYLTLGDVVSAQKYGAQSVTFADRSGDGDWKGISRCKEADALHQAGKNKTAEKLFIEAENKQKKRQPEYPWLYSLRGFQFCDLLLSMGKYQEALERARTTIEWVKNLLSIALDNLSIGKALMLQSIQNISEDFSKAENFLNLAVDGLRESGEQIWIASGLLKRSILYKTQKNYYQSWADLDEAKEIAEYGQMRLHLTDYHMEACRNIKAQLADTSDSLSEFEIIENGTTLQLTKEEMQARFQEHFKKAERLISETGYHRRDGELEELKDNK